MQSCTKKLTNELLRKSVGLCYGESDFNSWSLRKCHSPENKSEQEFTNEIFKLFKIINMKKIQVSLD